MLSMLIIICRNTSDLLYQYFTVPPYSIWNPYGIHMEWIYSMESTWNPCGICTFHLAYMWIPHGFHMECKYSTWNPHGIHMESMWNEYIPWNPCGMNPF